MAPDSGASSIVNAGVYNMYQGIANPNVVGKRKFVDVLSPAQKVVVYDSEARHFGRRSWNCASPEAKQPLLFFDGHVKIYANGVPSNTGVVSPIQQKKGNQVNPGWNPRSSATFNFLNYAYSDPEPWEAPLRNGGYTGTDTMTGFFRYTRGGLKGVDVESPEPYFAN
jgi:hypothetical protein